MPKTKIAIACQGGGTHTAFTAGVLKHFLENDIQKKYKIVGLTGTSGGAVCATATMYGLLKAANGGTEPSYQPLIDFWYANTPQSPAETVFAMTTDAFLRIAESGRVPTFPANPYRTTPVLEAAMPLFPRREFLDFRALLEAHIDFEELLNLIDDDSPRLLLGAANILTGEFKAFDSWVPGEISVDAVLASAAVPNVFEAVHVGDGVYWDGLFSQNPPVAQLMKTEAEKRPDEVWVVLINPVTSDEEPKTSGAIADRRNELAGNISLYQELHFIERVNQWIEKGYFRPDIGSKLKPIKIRVLTLSKQLSDSLNYSTKLSRDRDLVDTLIADGEAQAGEFLGDLALESPIEVAQTA
jgi:NTE family protein